MDVTGLVLFKIQQEVRRLAEMYPDAIYEPYQHLCCYDLGSVRNGPQSCGCLLGHAMRQANFKFDQSSSIGITYILGQKLSVDSKHPTVLWLSIAQTAQDTLYSWSRAVQLADQLCN